MPAKKRRWGWVVGACALALLLPLVSPAAAPPAANVAGTWELSIEGRRGTMTRTLTIEQDGNKIQGTIEGRRGSSHFQGTVNGDRIRFSVKRETPRGEFEVDYSGKVDGDAMKGSARMRRFEIDWTAKRRK